MDKYTELTEKRYNEIRSIEFNEICYQQCSYMESSRLNILHREKLNSESDDNVMISCDYFSEGSAPSTIKKYPKSTNNYNNNQSKQFFNVSGTIDVADPCYGIKKKKKKTDKNSFKDFKDDGNENIELSAAVDETSFNIIEDEDGNIGVAYVDEDEEQNKNMVLLNEPNLRKYLFKGVSFKSQMFKYTMYGHLTSKIHKQFKIFDVKSVDLEPLPFTDGLLKYYLQNVLCLSDDYIDLFFSSEVWYDDYEYVLACKKNDGMEGYIYDIHKVKQVLKQLARTEIDAILVVTETTNDQLKRTSSFLKSSKSNNNDSNNSTDIENSEDESSSDEFLRMKHISNQVKNLPKQLDNGKYNMQKSTLWRAFKIRLESMRYFMHDYIDDLRKFYCDELISLMNNKTIKKLHRTLVTEPWKLLYNAQIRSLNLVYMLAPLTKSAMYIPGSSYGLMYIPELDYGDFQRILKTFRITERCKSMKKNTQISKKQKTQSHTMDDINDNQNTVVEDPYANLENKYDSYIAKTCTLPITLDKIELEIMKAKIYTELKVAIIYNKHMYVTDSYMRNVIKGITKYHTIYNRSIKELSDVKICDAIVCVEDEDEEEIKLYSKETHRWEIGMVKLFEYLICNQISNQTHIMNHQRTKFDSHIINAQTLVDRYSISEERLNRFTTFANHKLCDEQKRFVTSILTNPICIGNGKGGAGKTDTLKVLDSMYKPNEILATSWMGKIATKLDTFYNGQSFTTHKLICTHNSICMDSPYTCDLDTRIEDHKKIMKKNPNFEDKLRNKIYMSSIGIPYNRCIFEDIKVLIVDESSTQYSEILVTLIAGLIRCGSLEKVIMTGDGMQLPSLRSGNVFKQIFIGLEDTSAITRFEHNHRVAKGSQLIVDNANHIANGDASKIVFDDVNVIHIDFESRANDPEWKDDLKKKIGAVLYNKMYDINEYETHIIARMNSVKDAVVHEFDRKFTDNYKFNCYFIGRKILFARNDYTLGIFANQVLIIHDIIDINQKTRLPLTTVDKILYIKENGSHLNSTGERRLKKGDERYLICFPLIDGNDNSKKPDDDKLMLLKWREKFVKENIRRACVTTNHAFQGDQCKTMISIIPYPSGFDTLEALYTMFTRAKERQFYIGSIESLNRAVSQREPPRNSNLGMYIHMVFDAYKADFNIQNEKFQSFISEKENMIRNESDNAVWYYESTMDVDDDLFVEKNDNADMIINENANSNSFLNVDEKKDIKNVSHVSDDEDLFGDNQVSNNVDGNITSHSNDINYALHKSNDTMSIDLEYPIALNQKNKLIIIDDDDDDDDNTTNNMDQKTITVNSTTKQKNNFLHFNQNIK